VVKGISTGFIPNHVRIKNTEKNHQNDWVIILLFGFCVLLVLSGRISKIKIDISKHNTPPSLLGIARKMAYANRKYHSGWMWVGVTIGFAGVKLSGSIRM